MQFERAPLFQRNSPLSNFLQRKKKLQKNAMSIEKSSSESTSRLFASFSGRREKEMRACNIWMRDSETAKIFLTCSGWSLFIRDSFLRYRVHMKWMESTSTTSHCFYCDCNSERSWRQIANWTTKKESKSFAIWWRGREWKSARECYY